MACVPATKYRKRRPSGRKCGWRCDVTSLPCSDPQWSPAWQRPFGGHLKQPAAAFRREENDAVLVPRSAFTTGCVTDDTGLPSVNVDDFQLAFRDKRYRPAVGRPEVVAAEDAVAPLDASPLQGIDWAKPEHVGATRADPNVPSRRPSGESDGNGASGAVLSVASSGGFTENMTGSRTPDATGSRVNRFPRRSVAMTRAITPAAV